VKVENFLGNSHPWFSSTRGESWTFVIWVRWPTT